MGDTLKLRRLSFEKMRYNMRKFFSLIALLVALCHTDAVAQEFVHRPPIYIVNGVRTSEEQVRLIDPDDIVGNTLLPADEESVAK